MRGTDPNRHRLFPTSGITPARAGNRIHRERKDSGGQDHPRACGEQALAGPACAALVWITPARAGNSADRGRADRQRRDHPRACGEQKHKLKAKVQCRGSPPRVRGTGPGTVYGPAASWITPARAGNRPRIKGRRHQIGDHPRACGEQRNTKRFGQFFAGSPPRVRGTARLQFPFSRFPGITPARAGNSLPP